MKGLARLFGLGPDAAISPADKKQPPETAVEPEEYKDAEAPAMPEKEVRLLPIDEIVPNPFQPRKKFNEAALADLAASIGEFGIIQPLVVRQIENSFELVAGERRLRASKLAGLKEVPVVIKMLTDKETAEIA
ncbi:MAG: ParB/RepB/Spo0J family partition protein, partial [Selenomonadaceae bacterium]